MNNNVRALYPYPFAKMSQLLANSAPSPAYTEIKLDIGEPKHEPPSFVLDVLKENLDSIACYPTTIGSFELRQTIAHWLEKRFFCSMSILILKYYRSWARVKRFLVLSKPRLILAQATTLAH